MISRAVERLFRFDGVKISAIAFAPEQGDVFVMTATEGARSLRFNIVTNRWCADSQRRALDVAVSPRGQVAWLLPDSRVRLLDEDAIADGDDPLEFRGTTNTIRIDPTTVSQPVTVRGLFVHTYLLEGPAVLELRVVDARTGDTVPPATEPAMVQTYTTVGTESRSTEQVNLATFGHRISWRQPPGDTGKIVIVQIDSEVVPADQVIARTVTQL